MRPRLLLLAAVAAGAALYAPALVAMCRQWVEDTTTAHGLLLAAAAAVVAYRKRHAFTALPVRPDSGGVVLVFAGLGLFVLGTFGAEVFVLRFSFPLVALGCVAALWGRPQARLLISAFGLLLLAIPLPGVVVTWLTMPLQLVASRLAEALLAAGQIPVIREGNLLRLDHVTLEVAEACSGLRSATSLISVAAVCAALFRFTWPRGLFLMLLSVPIAILGNGARVAATGYFTQWFGEGAARGVPHDLTGYAAFAVMFAVSVMAIRLTRPSRAKPSAPIPARA